MSSIFTLVLQSSVTESKNMEGRGCFSLFAFVSGIIAFIVDVIAFLSLFGISFIVSPSTTGDFNGRVVMMDFPVSAEVFTFLAWFYAALIIVFFSAVIVNSNRGYYSSTPGLGIPGVLLLIFSPLVAMSWAVWLGGFGYIPSWLYIFMIPTMGFVGLSWYAGLCMSARSMVGVVVLLLAIGPAILWLRAGFDWGFGWIIFVSFISLLIGSLFGFVGSFLVGGLTQ